MGRRRQVSEMLRRVYGEVVRGRTRVRVVSESSIEGTTVPKFLLSPYRSGTTLFRYCMDSHPDLAVPPETDFIAPLMGVLDDEASISGLASLGYDREDFQLKLGQFARKFLDTYAESKGANAGWMDKSPRYAEAPTELRDLFPTARFVILHRHPLDQIHSFTRGGTFVHPALRDAVSGFSAILSAAHYWNNVTSGLLDFGEGADDTIEIKYETLCSKPRQTLERTTRHFGLDWTNEVLNYHEHDHDLGREAGRVAGTVGFARASGGWRSWDAEWQDSAWNLVADTAERIGYRRDSDGS